MHLSQGQLKNLYTYTGLLPIASIGIWYGQFLSNSYPSLRIWDLANLLLMLIGIPFLFWQRQAGLPDFWDEQVSNRRRFLLPLGIGLFFGLLDVMVFKFILHP